MTTVTEVRSTSRLLVCGAPWWVLLQHYYDAISLHRPVWYRALPLHYACIQNLCIILIRYRCGKFRFFRGLHCWTSPWRKLAYSMDRRRSQPTLGREPRPQSYT